MVAKLSRRPLKPALPRTRLPGINLFLASLTLWLLMGAAAQVAIRLLR